MLYLDRSNAFSNLDKVFAQLYSYTGYTSAREYVIKRTAVEDTEIVIHEMA